LDDVGPVGPRELRSDLLEDAGEHFGFLSAFVPLDNPTSSALTQERPGWRPVQPALIPDLEKGHYFDD
jgi:hypothetical protein